VRPTTARRARRAVPPLLVLAAVAALAAPAYANPPPDQTPVGSGAGQTVAAVRNPSDKDPWPDPPVLDIDVSGDGSTKNGPNAAIAGPPPDPPPVDSVTAVTTAAVAGPPPVLVEE
jgi:hypothetical protein